MILLRVDRNRSTLVYSSAAFCLGFRAEKWLAASSSSRPSSETVYFTGMQRTCTFALRSNQQQQSGSSELSKTKFWLIGACRLPPIRFLPLSTLQRRRPWKRCSSQTLQTSATSERRWAWNEAFCFHPSWFKFLPVTRSHVTYVCRRAGEKENKGLVKTIILAALAFWCLLLQKRSEEPESHRLSSSRSFAFFAPLSKWPKPRHIAAY